MANYIRYANQGATRNLPLDPKLVQALAFLPELGLSAEVFSGGQPAKGSGGARVGSVRHDHGAAADVFFTREGRRLDWENPQDQPIFQDIVRRGKAAGITGWGAGPGYMQQGSMHVGFGSPGVWGAGGKGANAPDWLRQAYGGGAPAAAAPVVPAPATTNNRMMSPTPVAQQGGIQPGQVAPATFGDVVAPKAVQTIPIDVPGFGDFIAERAQVAQLRQQEETERQRRRALLFAPV